MRLLYSSMSPPARKVRVVVTPMVANAPHPQ